MIARRTAFALTLLANPALAAPAGEAGTIRHLLHATFDRPEAPLTIDPVVVAHDHAIAGWSQEGRGGRALLRRHHGKWAIALCAGDALKGADLMLRAGVPAADAARLTADLARAEAKLPPARLALLASFDGVMMMDEQAAHGTAGHP
ncbi:MAG: copper uptake system-associated protein [Paracraurococcus sp.]